MLKFYIHPKIINLADLLYEKFNVCLLLYNLE